MPSGATPLLLVIAAKSAGFAVAVMARLMRPIPPVWLPAGIPLLANCQCTPASVDRQMPFLADPNGSPMPAYAVSGDAGSNSTAVPAAPSSTRDQVAPPSADRQMPLGALPAPFTP